ncbi:MAG: hypothetical protein SGILL_005349, partial [Bacillariaceae sp.]
QMVLNIIEEENMLKSGADYAILMFMGVLEKMPLASRCALFADRDSLAFEVRNFVRAGPAENEESVVRYTDEHDPWLQETVWQQAYDWDNFRLYFVNVDTKEEVDDKDFYEGPNKELVHRDTIQYLSPLAAFKA